MALSVPPGRLQEARFAASQGAGPRVEFSVAISAPNQRQWHPPAVSLRGSGAAGARRRSTIACAATTPAWSQAPSPSPSWHGRSNFVKHARSFVDNDSLCYLRSFFDPKTFHEMREETVRLRSLLRKEKNGTAVDRMGMYMKVRQDEGPSVQHKESSMSAIQ